MDAGEGGGKEAVLAHQWFVSALASFVHHTELFTMPTSFAIQDCLDVRHLKHQLLTDS